MDDFTASGYRAVPGFLESLAPFDAAVFTARADTVYGLDADLRLAFLNPEWFRFAAANGGEPAIARDWGLGRHVLEACPPILRAYYAEAFASALAKAERWDHLYECSSAGEYRQFRLSAYPLADGAGLLVVNARVLIRAHDVVGSSDRLLMYAGYRDGNGYVHQCAHCRRTKRPGALERWDWVPELVSDPIEETSHDLCRACLDFYYPG